MILRIQFELRRLQYKIQKIGEFYQMYKKWVLFFDSKTDEMYKLKYKDKLI